MYAAGEQHSIWSSVEKKAPALSNIDRFTMQLAESLACHIQTLRGLTVMKIHIHGTTFPGILHALKVRSSANLSLKPRYSLLPDLWSELNFVFLVSLLSYAICKHYITKQICYRNKSLNWLIWPFVQSVSVPELHKQSDFSHILQSYSMSRITCKSLLFTNLVCSAVYTAGYRIVEGFPVYDCALMKNTTRTELKPIFYLNWMLMLSLATVHWITGWISL